MFSKLKAGATEPSVLESDYEKTITEEDKFAAI